jgi:hypothetical protein
MIEASSKLDRVLMDCIQAIEEKGWTIEDCLNLYPHVRQDLKPMLEAAIRLRDVSSVEPSLRFKRETLGRMQLRLQASRRPPKPTLYSKGVTSERSIPERRIHLKKRSSLQWVMTILVGAFAFVAMIGGFTYVANAANPGDILYPVDQIIEGVQIRLTPSAEGRAKLYLSFASERINEAFALIEKGKSDQVIVALQRYDVSIQSAETIFEEDLAGKDNYQSLTAVLDRTLELQTEKLQQLMVVAPTAIQSSIQTAILKISDFRVAMVITSPIATATPPTEKTPSQPEPTETGMASATVHPTTPPIASGTPIPSSPPVASSTPNPPTATSVTPMVSPTAIASQTPMPTYPVATPTPLPTFTHTPTPTPTPSYTPIHGPDLTVSPYQWPDFLSVGSTEFLDYLVRNIGTTAVQDGYLIQLYVDDIPLQNIDPEIGVREGRALYAGEVDLNYFFWTATCGVHKLKIVVDDENIIQETNESNNTTEDYTITVDCGTATPP